MSISDAERVQVMQVGDIGVAIHAAGEGPQIVMIHGLGQDHRIWADIQHELPQYHTYAYDLRGHGQTTLGNSVGTLAQLGQDLIALLEETGPATCMGFSLGGSVALWAAAERPDLIPQVVAVATSSVVGSGAARAMEERIARIQLGDRATLRALILEDTVAQLAGADIDPVALTDSRLNAVPEVAGYINGARAILSMRADPLTSRLSGLAARVLVVSGSRDVWCPRRAAEIMLESLPNASFVELPGVGHLVTDIAPRDLVTAVREWWDAEVMK